MEAENPAEYLISLHLQKNIIKAIKMCTNTKWVKEKIFRCPVIYILLYPRHIE